MPFPLPYYLTDNTVSIGPPPLHTLSALSAAVGDVLAAAAVAMAAMRTLRKITLLSGLTTRTESGGSLAPHGTDSLTDNAQRCLRLSLNKFQDNNFKKGIVMNPL